MYSLRFDSECGGALKESRPFGVPRRPAETVPFLRRLMRHEGAGRPFAGWPVDGGVTPARS